MKKILSGAFLFLCCITIARAQSFDPYKLPQEASGQVEIYYNQGGKTKVLRGYVTSRDGYTYSRRCDCVRIKILQTSSHKETISLFIPAVQVNPPILKIWSPKLFYGTITEITGTAKVRIGAEDQAHASLNIMLTEKF